MLNTKDIHRKVESEWMSRRAKNPIVSVNILYMDFETTPEEMEVIFGTYTFYSTLKSEN